MEIKFFWDISPSIGITLRTGWRNGLEFNMLIADVSWPPSELMKYWSWSVDIHLWCISNHVLLDGLGGPGARISVQKVMTEFHSIMCVRCIWMVKISLISFMWIFISKNYNIHHSIMGIFWWFILDLYIECNNQSLATTGWKFLLWNNSELNSCVSIVLFWSLNCSFVFL